MGEVTHHGPNCPRPYKGKCLKFSTDGTRLGVDIAHTMGTDDEEAITARGLKYSDIERDIPLGQVDEEQRDWEEGLDDDSDPYGAEGCAETD